MDKHLLRFDKEKTYTFIDAETLNLCLNFCHNLPWQVAMIKVKGDTQNSKDFYIKWKTDLTISEDAARITRYDPIHVQKIGILPEEAFPTIDDWLRNCDYIVGHNILGFDYYLLKEWYKIYGKDSSFILPKILDTNCLAKGMKLNIPFKQGESLIEYQYKMYHKRQKGLKTNLTALGKEFGIEHDYLNLHNAIVDLELNIKVFNQLKYKIEI